MAEISYPFAEPSAGGGTDAISQVQWQAMARMWTTDKIDFQLTDYSYAANQLPFHATIPGSRTVEITPGKAWVGGFYYELTEPMQLAIPDNPGNLDRIDTIVVRADIAAGSVNLAVVTGTPASSPREPLPVRVPGDTWEMVLWVVNSPKNSGAITLRDARKFDVPERVAVPWNAEFTIDALPYGALGLDMDVNTNWVPFEAFKSRDGLMITRTLGNRRPYTPDLFTVTNKPSAYYREGHWRWVAPGTVSFSMTIRNTSTKPIAVTSGTTIIGTTLPVDTNNATQQVVTGFLDNPQENSGMPNMMHIVGKTGTGVNKNLYLYVPNWKTVAGGLDALTTIPAKSTLTISGQYETGNYGF